MQTAGEPRPIGELPTGTVTFLFTDIEGSVARWERDPDRMRLAIAQHDAILHEAVDRHRGALYQLAGDSFLVAFASAPPALEAALWAQRRLTTSKWPAGIGPLRVRMAIHTGLVELRANRYDANHVLSRQARLLAAAHGGQVLVSHESREFLVDDLPAGVELRDLGRLWLRDLVEPVGVHQVVASLPPWSLPSEFPPLRGHTEMPGNLPNQSLPFIGRAQALDDLCEMVSDGRLRLTTLVGTGGIGKTSLALRAADRLRHRFADGVFFVDLTAITDHRLVLPTVAAEVGVSERDGRSATDALAEHLADRHLLLILDNLEQVVDAAPGIAALLTAAPRLRILATSRVPLHVLEEAQFAVSPLEVPDPAAASDPASLAEVESVALFVQRARAAERNFELGPHNASAVAAICRRLEGVALAVVLAAARSGSLSPEAMLARLDDRLALLTDGARNLPTRHQTLRDTLEWSHELLDEDEKALYARWSVFVGGFRRDAAEALATDDGHGCDALGGLDSLVDHSLLGAHQTADGDTRYRMLESISEHAREKLAQRGDAGTAERLHARHFLDLAQRAAEQLEGEHMVEWSARLDEEHDNLRAALARGFARVERGDPTAAELVVRLSSALALFWLDRGHLTEGGGHLDRALAVAPLWRDSADDEQERRHANRACAHMLDILGGISRRRGDLDGAEASLRESLEIYRELGDDRNRGRVLSSLGTVAHHRGDIAEGRRRCTAALELSRTAGDRFNVVNLLVSLGNLERDAGDHERARAFYEECLAVAEDIHEFIGQSVALNNLANLALAEGDPERAENLHLQSLEIRHRVGHRMMLAESLVGVACVDIALGRPLRAARLVGCAERVAEDVGGGFDPMERQLHDRAVTALAATLDADRFHDEREGGRAMGVEAAVAAVLGGPSPA